MAAIPDYRCGYENTSDPEFSAKDLDRFPFPDAYTKKEWIADLSQAVREESGAVFCVLPFCHTLEAEALGAQIIPGDSRTAPRAGKPRFQTVGELLRLPGMDFHSPRLEETLQACRILKKRGETVLFQISGPFTVFNSLISADMLFYALVKQYDDMTELLHKTGRDLIRLMELAQESGAGLISYADPMGSVKILGPSQLNRISRDFTAPFLAAADRSLDRETPILLCPKTALALTGSGLAGWNPLPLPEACTYDRAAMKMRGKIRFGGQTCVKAPAFVDTFQELLLKSDQEEFL